MPVKSMCYWNRVLKNVAAAARIPFAMGIMATGAATLSQPAYADDPLDELRQRIAQLEQDNRELRANSLQSSSGSIAPLVAALPPEPGEPPEPETEEERRIGSLVQKYMRRLESQQSSQSSTSDPAQDQKIANLENNLSGVMKKIYDPKAANGVFNNDGLFFSTADGNFKLRFGGTAQIDYVGMGPANHGVVGIPSPYGLQNSVEFRRLRWRAEGTMWQNVDYVSEFDFALALQNTDPGISGTNNGSNPDNGLQATTANGGNGIQSGNTQSVIQPTTVFATIKEVPILGNVRVGQQQDWFSMEHIESARFTDFMERAPIMDAFAGPNNNGYTTGVSFFDNTQDKNFGWQAGIYKGTAYDSGYTFSMGNGWTSGGRAIWTPYYDEESNGANLLHLGIGSEYRRFNQDLNSANQGANIRLRSRGDLRNAASTLDPNFADTGNFFATSQALIDPEFAFQYGPFLLQAEYTASFINGARPFQNSAVRLGDNGNLFMYGGYVEALYFLTGEHRSYNRQSGVFGRTIPKDNLSFGKCTYGAWQTGIRYDWLSLQDGQVNGGRNQDLTLGINWWLNPNMRFMFNYVFSYINNGGAGPAFGNGTLVGSKFTGDGMIQSVGGRLDMSY